MTDWIPEVGDRVIYTTTTFVRGLDEPAPQTMIGTVRRYSPANTLNPASESKKNSKTRRKKEVGKIPYATAHVVMDGYGYAAVLRLTSLSPL